MTAKKVLAVDLGGSSGRIVLGQYENGKIQASELYRFPNEPVIINGTMYWDILRIFHEIKNGLLKARPYFPIESIAIDTWGVDFGLLDESGHLLDNPVHYRDKRTEGMLSKALEKVDGEKLYSLTGNQFMEINTAFQLMALAEKRPKLLENSDKLLTIPALLSYFLGAEPVVEHSMASTTQLYDQKNHGWSWSVIKSLGIPCDIFPNITDCGTEIGKLSDDICQELDIPQINISAVCSHDTQSAQLAVPAEKDDFLFISSGTWSLVGTELDNPILTKKAMDLELTNEAAFGGKTSFMKNIIGLWLIQESRRQWIREGKEYSFAQLEELAEAEAPFKCFIDPDDPVFMPSGNIPKRIQDYCKASGQPVPETIGQIVRCIDESLALKYRKTKSEIEECTQKSYDHIYMVGGGAQSKLLCRLTADISGVPVTAGPTEATVYGNIAAQLLSIGEFKSIAEIRSNISNLSDIKTYIPNKIDGCEQAYKKFVSMI